MTYRQPPSHMQHSTIPHPSSHLPSFHPQWLFPFKGMWVVPLKVAFDQTIWSGIWNTIYFVTLGLLRFEKLTTIASELRATFLPMLTVSYQPKPEPKPEPKLEPEPELGFGPKLASECGA